MAENVHMTKIVGRDLLGTMLHNAVLQLVMVARRTQFGMVKLANVILDSMPLMDNALDVRLVSNLMDPHVSEFLTQ